MATCQHTRRETISKKTSHFTNSLEVIRVDVCMSCGTFFVFHHTHTSDGVKLLGQTEFRIGLPEHLKAASQFVCHNTGATMRLELPGDVMEYTVEDLPILLRRLRELHDMTLAQQATRSGLSISYLSDIERGRTPPTLLTLRKIMDCYDLRLVFRAQDHDAEPLRVPTGQESRLLKAIQDGQWGLVLGMLGSIIEVKFREQGVQEEDRENPEA